MGVRQVIGRSIKKKFDIRSWAGFDSVKGNAALLKTMAQDLLEEKRKKRRTFDNFEQAIFQLNLSPTQLQKKAKNSWYLAISYLIFTLFIFIYAFYLFYQHLWLGGMTALLLMGITGVLAFREHFTYFQIQQRQLRLSYKDWLRFLLGQRK